MVHIILPPTGNHRFWFPTEGKGNLAAKFKTNKANENKNIGHSRLVKDFARLLPMMKQDPKK